MGNSNFSIVRQRIFISMHYLEIGGAESALIGLLKSFDYTKYDVDLFLYSHRGEMMQFIPKEVNLLPQIKEYAHIECPMKQALIDGYWGVLYGRLKAKLLTKRYMRKKGISESTAGLQFTADSVSPYLPTLFQFGEYDLAISFLTPHNFVIEKVNAKKKICWIHTDYSSIDINAEQEFSVWNAYDKIVSISPDVTVAFLRVFPSLKNKIIEMENIIPSELVRERANEFDVSAEMPRNDNTINLLSVGRFCEAKNYDNVPDICRRILSSVSIPVKWFIIGYGPEEQLIRGKIREAGMENNVILLGKKSNPYPYMKACDIYVQPSRYEGKSVTVREAQILCKPVVVTNYPTASSQINDGLDGVIVPMDNHGCAEGIVELINDKKKQLAFIHYLETHDYGNDNDFERLIKMV